MIANSSVVPWMISQPTTLNVSPLAANTATNAPSVRPLYVTSSAVGTANAKPSANEKIAICALCWNR